MLNECVLQMYAAVGTRASERERGTARACSRNKQAKGRARETERDREMVGLEKGKDTRTDGRRYGERVLSPQGDHSHQRKTGQGQHRPDNAIIFSNVPAAHACRADSLCLHLLFFQSSSFPSVARLQGKVDFFVVCRNPLLVLIAMLTGALVNADDSLEEEEESHVTVGL